jgi:hypothetical protein
MAPVTDNVTGYSGTPLVKKLGIKESYSLLLINAPENYFELVSPLPPNVRIANRGDTNLDFIHYFGKRLSIFEERFFVLKKKLKKDGIMWISWPKGSAGIPTDMNRDLIREFILQSDMVDVKVCAIDETWSGLKFVYRKEFR